MPETVRYFYLNPIGLSYEDFGGEMVAVNFDTGKYYGLTGSALTTWQLLIRPRSLDELIAEMERIYSEGEHDIREMTVKFVGILESEGLLIHIDVPEMEFLATSDRPPFVAPGLEVHSDLQELIMLDPVHDADPEHGWPVRRPEAAGQ
ncbi:MAG: PqqD family protein [Anderseniella sp.]